MTGNPLDLVECEGCNKDRYREAVRPGPDDGPTTCCTFCSSMQPTCETCGEEISEPSLGLCAECVDEILHEACTEHPCPECASDMADAAEYAMDARADR